MFRPAPEIDLNISPAKVESSATLTVTSTADVYGGTGIEALLTTGEAPRSRHKKSSSIWQGLDFRQATTDSAGDDFTYDVSPLIITEPAHVVRTLALPDSTQQSCQVPGCSLTGCRLSTHRKYDPFSSKQKLQRKRPQDGTRDAHEALMRLQSYAPIHPSSDGVDGFPILPLQEGQDIMIRALFHHFFTNTFERLALIFRGPAITNMTQFKERMLATALTSETYCRALILQARTDQDHRLQQPTGNKESLKIYDDTLTVFREHVNLIRQRPHPLQIELALLVICILMMFDSTHGRIEAQKVHWQGLKDLVAMRGGMHCVTMALAYIVHADRACAIRFDESPTYASPLTQALPMPAPIAGIPRYGSKFYLMKEPPISIDPAVLDYLTDASVLVDFWEQSRLGTARRQPRDHVPSLEYLHFIRDRLDERFALLNSKWATIKGPERCLLWASRLVEYPLTWFNYVVTMTHFHCRKLTMVLQEELNVFEVWRYNLDVLVWILFTISTTEPIGESHQWAISRLQELLNTKYGQPPWRSMWWADEQENLLGFIWSSSHYAEQFQNVCNELEQRSASNSQALPIHQRSKTG